MLGRSVCTIPSHGAVARSVAARAHTAFPACNLRLTFNLPSFINSTVNLSRRSEVNNQTPLLLSSTSTINCFAGCLHKVSAQTFYFSPWKEILFGPLAPAIVGSKFGSIYNRITVKHFSLCLLSLIVKLVSIDCFIRGALTQFVLFLNTVAHRCPIKQNISKLTCVVIDGWPTKNAH